MYSSETNALHLLRELAPQVLGVLARKTGDFTDAEDALQEALIAAAEQWPAAGVPSNPRGWLYHVAIRRWRDQLRSDTARRTREEVVVSEAETSVPFSAHVAQEIGLEEDDTLILLFMCCHPSLSTSSAIILTLRAVGGLTTAEIAKAFLMPEATMAQRISRAKASIKTSGISFVLPTPAERQERLSAVLHVLYLMFNEGYTSSGGKELNRVDLSDEAIRLTRNVYRLLPAEPEIGGLLALMLLTDARRSARTGLHGELIPLDEQNRSLWNQKFIAEGGAIVEQVLSRGVVGPYQLQAAIAAVHDESQRSEDTDWPQIFMLYDLLRKMSDNPMVTLNYAIALAMVRGAEAGLQLLAELEQDARIRGHYRLHAVRAHFLEMAGNKLQARAEYQAAAEKTNSLPERDYLLLKAARVAVEQKNIDLESAH